MAKSDMLFRVQADTKNYDANLAKARKQLEGFKNDNMSAGGVMKQMSSTLVSTATKFASFGAAVAGAMKVAKDAFFNNEQQLDEWGRIVASSESIYKGFLNSLNTGDISGFLANIQTITQAARDAYDALDELATFNAFNKANIAGARADLTGSIADYREGTGSKESIQAASNALIKELQTKQQLQADAYKKVIAKVAAERGVSANDLLKVMTGSWGSFKELKDMKLTGSRMVSYSGGMFGGGGYYKEAAPSNERERLAQAVKHLNDTEIDNFQSLAEAAKMTQVEIDNQRKMVARVLNGRQGSTGGGGGGGRSGTTGGGSGNGVTYAPDSIAAQEAEVQRLTKAWKEASAEMRDDYLKQLNEAKNLLEDIMIPLDKMLKPTGEIGGDLVGSIKTFGGLNDGSVTVPPEVLAKIAAAAMPAQKDNGFLHYTENGQAAYVKLNETLGGLASGMSQMVSGMEALGIDIPEGIKSAINAIQGVSSILTGISTTLLAIEAISSADAIIPFARGGVVKAAGGWSVPGNYNSMDQVPALLNSGELVLNRFQQQALAGALNNPMGNLHLSASLSGETINLAVKAGNIRRGRGEYVTTKTQRYGYNLDA